MKLYLSHVCESNTLGPAARSLSLGTPPCVNEPDTRRPLLSRYRLGGGVQAAYVWTRGMAEGVNMNGCCNARVQAVVRLEGSPLISESHLTNLLNIFERLVAIV
jgi:hypothetical protein